MGKKITMFSTESSSIQERFEQYLSAASAKGLSSKTLKTYRQHFHCISKHLDITVPLSSLSRAQVDAAIVSMRNSGLSANSISSYLRAFNSFLTWCRENGYSGLTVPNYKPKETVKETYSDSELSLLLKRPSASCSFVEYRSWVIVQFLLNSGCRASTIRNIQNRDIDLESRQVTFRHTKTGKIQVIRSVLHCLKIFVNICESGVVRHLTIFSALSMENSSLKTHFACQSLVIIEVMVFKALLFTSSVIPLQESI